MWGQYSLENSTSDQSRYIIENLQDGYSFNDKGGGTNYLDSNSATYNKTGNDAKISLTLNSQRAPPFQQKYKNEGECFILVDFIAVFKFKFIFL